MISSLTIIILTCLVNYKCLTVGNLCIDLIQWILTHLQPTVDSLQNHVLKLATAEGWGLGINPQGLLLRR